MNDAIEKEEKKAFKEYLDAVDEHSQLLGPTRKFYTDRKIVFRQWNSESELDQYLKKLEKANARITEARKKWDETLRRRFGC